MEAEDKDVNENAVFQYHIVGGDDKFDISNDGVIVTKATLDYESKTSFTFLVSGFRNRWVLLRTISQQMVEDLEFSFIARLPILACIFINTDNMLHKVLRRSFRPLVFIWERLKIQWNLARNIK